MYQILKIGSPESLPSGAEIEKYNHCGNLISKNEQQECHDEKKVYYSNFLSLLASDLIFGALKRKSNWFYTFSETRS